MNLPVPVPVASAAPTPSASNAAIRRYVLIGTLACLLVVFGFGGWAATAQLSSAVIAGGTVVVASNVKQVQHPDGGIVGAIPVRDGDDVSAGDLLVRLDDTLVAANRALLDGQIIALEARLARLRAERDDESAIAMPAEFVDRPADALVQAALSGERKVFEARKATIAGQTDRLTERISQLRDQVSGLNVQLEANGRELALIEEEREILQKLYDRGNTTRDRIVSVQRTQTRLQGERGDLESQIAVARGRMNETELEILQLTIDQREKTFAEITEVEPEMANLKERRIAADFQLKRMDILSPDDGTVFELAVHTVGGVIQPAETIMQIVPDADQLVVEARISPNDVDQMSIGQETVVVLSAFDHRTTPQLFGHVTFVAAEASIDEQTRIPYYVVRVMLNESELDRLPDNLTLLPGMPAECYIATGGQTVVEYLMRPLTEQFRRVWREA